MFLRERENRIFHADIWYLLPFGSITLYIAFKDSGEIETGFYICASIQKKKILR